MIVNLRWIWELMIRVNDENKRGDDDKIWFWLEYV